MSLMLNLKRAAGNIPPPLGRLLARVPFSWRLGPVYANTQRDIESFSRLATAEKKAEIARRFVSFLKHVRDHNAFYGDLYARSGLEPGSVAAFEDVEKVPIVTKNDLRAVDLEARSSRGAGRILTNTGGSSGQPLHFYLDRHAFAREWAHMRFIWAKIGYETTDLKLTFRGKNLGDRPLKYNAVYNEYYVNAYAPPLAQAEAVGRIAKDIRVVHGYPSSIYEFVRYCAQENPRVLDPLRANLKGVLLASEYPAPVYRDLIEQELGAPTISWYGHSEMTILAYEVEKFVYAPFQTYGYCEAVPDGAGRHHLVGTSYYNLASPFIRYDTEDLISPEFDEGLLTRFRIESGRVGEFVEDANGSRISLTALIFGRHHEVFGKASFIQIRQEKPGKATIIVTIPEDLEVREDEIRAGFDDTNVAIDFDFETRHEPIRTPTGKVPLLVPVAADESQ